MSALSLVRSGGRLGTNTTFMARDFDGRLLIKRGWTRKSPDQHVLELVDIDEGKEKEHKFLPNTSKKNSKKTTQLNINKLIFRSGCCY